MKSLFAVVIVATMVATGCGVQTTQEISGELPLTPTAVTLCKDCGQVKGSDTCCAEGAETCDCGFHKGSPACCKVEKGEADITLCSKCGEAEGTDKCCAEGAETCDCGMHKGSPACCLETTGEDGEHEGEE